MDAADRLVQLLQEYGSCAVAFSAGVDSSVVAKAAHLALADSAVAVTGVGPALAEGELAQAKTIAGLIGICHEVVPTDEINNQSYRANGHDRCFHCKTELYTHVEAIADRLQIAVVANGANTDDLGDYRPGMQAAKNYSVRSPLVECGLNKQAVRELARHWELPVWDKPAAPCLASRIAYGVTVTPERLSMVDQAEQAVRAIGPREVRVRCLEGDAARIEVAPEATAMLLEPQNYSALQAKLLEIGFSSVSVDPEGFRSGKLNDLLPMASLQHWRR